jgi:hypothetical protein
MNDGRSHDVASPEFATFSDIAAAVLYRGADGKLRHMHLPLVTMSDVGAAGDGGAVNIRGDEPHGSLLPESFYIRDDHHAGEFGECDLRLPAEFFFDE